MKEKLKTFLKTNKRIIIIAIILLSLFVPFFFLPIIFSWIKGEGYVSSFLTNNKGDLDSFILSFKNMNWSFLFQKIGYLIALCFYYLSFLPMIILLVYVVAYAFFAFPRRRKPKDFKTFKNSECFTKARLIIIDFYKVFSTLSLLYFVLLLADVYIFVLIENQMKVSLFLLAPFIILFTPSFISYLPLMIMLFVVIYDKLIVPSSNKNYIDDMTYEVSQLDLFTYLRALSGWGKSRLMAMLSYVSSRYLTTQIEKKKVRTRNQMQCNVDWLNFETTFKNDAYLNETINQFELLNIKIKNFKNKPKITKKKASEWLKDMTVKKSIENDVIEKAKSVINIYNNDIIAKNEKEISSLLKEKETLILSIIKYENERYNTNYFSLIFKDAKGEKYLHYFYLTDIRKCNIISNLPMIDRQNSDFKTDNLKYVHSLNLNSLKIGSSESNKSSFAEEGSIMIIDELDKIWSTNDKNIYSKLTELGVDDFVNVGRHLLTENFRCYIAAQKETSSPTTIRQGASYMLDFDKKCQQKNYFIIKIAKLPFLIINKISNSIMDIYSTKYKKEYRESSFKNKKENSIFSSKIYSFLELLTNINDWILHFYDRFGFMQYNITKISTDSQGTQEKTDVKTWKLKIRYGLRDENYYEYDTTKEVRMYDSYFFNNMLCAAKNDIMNNAPCYSSNTPSSSFIEEQELFDNLVNTTSNKDFLSSLSSSLFAKNPLDELDKIASKYNLTSKIVKSTDDKDEDLPF